MSNHVVLECIEKCLGLPGKSHSSNLTDDQCDSVRRRIRPEEYKRLPPVDIHLSIGHVKLIRAGQVIGAGAHPKEITELLPKDATAGSQPIESGTMPSKTVMPPSSGVGPGTAPKSSNSKQPSGVSLADLLAKFNRGPRETNESILESSLTEPHHVPQAFQTNQSPRQLKQEKPVQSVAITEGSGNVDSASVVPPPSQHSGHPSSLPSSNSKKTLELPPTGPPIKVDFVQGVAKSSSSQSNANNTQRAVPPLAEAQIKRNPDIRGTGLPGRMTNSKPSIQIPSWESITKQQQNDIKNYIDEINWHLKRQHIEDCARNLRILLELICDIFIIKPAFSSEKLKSQINDLLEFSIISKSDWKWFDEIRKDGNSACHPGKNREIADLDKKAIRIEDFITNWKKGYLFGPKTHPHPDHVSIRSARK
ncbi:DUF4145 domain-containing protein [Geothrix oryzae]|uniref:DUF4145 domain-containing protein n=1 Tax=Geothrix oryzae TaxID=2927975 RepID=UPI0035CBDD0C